MSDLQLRRSTRQAFFRGWARKCPKCGEGHIFDGYIKVNHTCATCREELFHQRADDAPPYFTMLIVMLFVVCGLLIVEQIYHPESWLQMAIWMPVALISALWFLPRIKGALIGFQWAHHMHGFDGDCS